METKKFPFKFSAMMIGLFVLLLLLCAAAVALTTWQFIGFLRVDPASVWEWMKYVLMYIVCLLVLIFTAAMLIKSQYIVTDKELILQFGIIRTKYPLKSVRSVRHFKGSDRLAVYFDDYKNKYAIIVVKERWYQDFVRALQERNPSIAFDFISAEEEMKK